MRSGKQQAVAAFVAYWKALLWGAICFVAGAFYGMSAAGTAFVAMLRGRGLL
jgi:hypothetical protein